MRYKDRFEPLGRKIATDKDGNRLNYRVGYWEDWPCDSTTTHNYYYFGTLEDARIKYMQLTLEQVLEHRKVEYVALDICSTRPSHDGIWYRCFEQWQSYPAWL